MEKQLLVASCQLSVKTKRLFFIIVFSLFFFHFSLSTLYAEEVTSKAAVVMEASTGRLLFAKNPNLKLLPASTTKLVTAMVVLDKANMNDMVTISETAAKVPSLKGTRFKAGETVTVQTLLYAALLRSSNDAAYALAESISGSEEKFVGLMNKKLIAIGTFDTRFINTTGLPGKDQHITAYDLAKIMRYALKYPMIKEIIGTREAEISTEEGRTIFLENTNKMLWSDGGAVGGKTGYTKAARHCFVYAGEKEDETVIVAILGAPSRKTLWSEAEMLEGKGFGVIASNEQPVIYFTKADYSASVRKVSYRKNSRGKTYSKNNKAKVIKISSRKKSKGTHEERVEELKERATKVQRSGRREDKKIIRAEVLRVSGIKS